MKEGLQSEHAKELDDLRDYYEKKLKDMENQLRQLQPDEAENQVTALFLCCWWVTAVTSNSIRTRLRSRVARILVCRPLSVSHFLSLCFRQ